MSWGSPFQLSTNVQAEVLFWQKTFHNTVYPMSAPSPKPEVLTYSDASDSGWGGVAVQVGGQEAVGNGSVEENRRLFTGLTTRTPRSFYQWAATNGFAQRMAFCIVVAPSRYQKWYMEMGFFLIFFNFILLTTLLRWFVSDSLRIQTFDAIFIAGAAASCVFTTGVPAFGLLALKLCFCGPHVLS